MDDTILEKIDEINEALEESFGPMQIDPTAQTMEETLSDMRRSMSANAAAMMKMMREGGDLAQKEYKEDPWFQSIAKYLITLRESRRSIKPPPCETPRSTGDSSLVYLRNSISGSVRSRVETISGSLVSRMDSLPSIKSKLSLENMKRFG